MSESDFKFDEKTVINAEITLMAVKRVIPAINQAINGKSDLNLDEYAFAAACAIDVYFGHRSKIEEATYLVVEAVAMSMAAQGTKKGHLGPLFETTLRLRIRGEMSKFEYGEESK